MSLLPAGTFLGRRRGHCALNYNYHDSRDNQQRHYLTSRLESPSGIIFAIANCSKPINITENSVCHNVSVEKWIHHFTVASKYSN